MRDDALWRDAMWRTAMGPSRRGHNGGPNGVVARPASGLG